MIKAVAGGGGRGMRAVTDAGRARGGLRRAAASEARPRSATATVYVEQLPAARPPHRGAGARRRHRRGRRTWASASAASSAATRSWSRSPRRPGCRPRCASGCIDGGRGAWRRRVALRAASAPSSSCVDAPTTTDPVRLHRGQRPPAGRAHGHRGGHRRRPRRGCSCGSPAGPRWPTSASPRPRAARRAAMPIQLRVNMETMARRRHGPARRRHARRAFELPSGPGVRVDTFGYAGYRTSPRFDSLLAKVIVPRRRAADFADAGRRRPTGRCREFRIEGVATNIGFLQSLLRHPDVVADDVSTPASSRTTLAELVGAAARRPRAAASSTPPAAGAPPPRRPGRRPGRRQRPARRAGPRQGSRRPARGPASPAPGAARRPTVAGAGRHVGRAARRMQGTVVSDRRGRGRRRARRASSSLVMEAMKMEHVIAADVGGHRCARSRVAVGDTVFEGHPLLFVEERRGRRRGAAPPRRPSTSTTSAPTSPRSLERHALRPRRRAGPTPWPGAARPASAPRARTSTTSCDPGTLRRVRPARDRRPAPPPHRRGPDRAHARPTAWSPASAASTASCSATTGAALRGDVLRLHRARRHAGHAEPPQEGPHVRARRAAAAAGRAVRRGRRRPARRHRRPASPASTAWPSPTSAG